MPRRKLENRNVRYLRKTVRGSYFVTLPVEFIRGLSWKRRQKIRIDIDKRRKRLIIKDWKK